MNIVAIGGGTGTSSVLSGLKEYPDLFITAIVTMMDDGGSNSVVRDEFGLLPLSDARKSILALSNSKSSKILRELFMYRFDKGKGISGHTLGNLIMIALSDITGSEKGAIEVSSDMFDVVGKILPVTKDSVSLVAKYKDGREVVGEHNIDESNNLTGIRSLRLSKDAKAYPDVIDSIINADFVIIGPGDLYTSILPNILVDGVSDAISKSRGKLIYISNLMSKKGETRGMTHLDLVIEIEKYIKRDLDYVLINNKQLPLSLLKLYENDGEHQFLDNLTKDNKGDRQIVRGDLISDAEIKKEKGDTLKRSLIRHDPDKLAQTLYHIFHKNIFDLFSEIIQSK